MAIGQRKRQKLRQRSRETGDATTSPRGEGGPLRGDWHDPDRSDLRRLRQAITHGWLDDAPQEIREAFVEATRAIVKTPRSDRHALAAAWVFIAADLANLRQEEALMALAS